MLIFAVVIAGGTFADTYTYTGGDVYQKDSWNNDWLDIKDRKDGTTYLWSSLAAPISGNDYVIDKTYPNVWFKIQSDNSKTFPGDSLTVDGSTVTVDAQGHLIRLTINNLAVEAGARLDTKTYGSYENYAHGLWLTGTPRIDGTLRVYHKVHARYCAPERMSILSRFLFLFVPALFLLITRLFLALSLALGLSVGLSLRISLNFSVSLALNLALSLALGLLFGRGGRSGFVFGLGRGGSRLFLFSRRARLPFCDHLAFLLGKILPRGIRSLFILR